MSTCPDDTDELEFLREFRQNLQEMRAEGLYCDAVLKAEGQSFPCHRIVLAAASPYFKAMFSSGMKESKLCVADIQEVTSDLLENTLDFIYSGKKNFLEDSNIEIVLHFADMAQIKALKLECEKYLCQDVDDKNCFQMYALGKTYNLEQLMRVSQQVMVKSFKDVAKIEAWSDLYVEDVLSLIQNDAIDLANENLVFDAVVRWINHDKEKRFEDFPKLLEFIRLPFCTPLYLTQVVAKHPFIMDTALMKYVYEALKFQNNVCKQHTLVNHQTKPRNSFNYHRKLVSIRWSGYYELNVDKFDDGWKRVSKKSDELFLDITKECDMPDGLFITAEDGGSYILKSNSRLTKLPSLNLSTSDHGLIYHDGMVYAIGGESRGNNIPRDVTSRVEVYDFSRKEWKHASPLPKALIPRRMSLSHAQHVYVFGGTLDTSMAVWVRDVYQYDPLHDVWHEKSPMPTTCNDGCVVSYNDDIYLFGGEEDLTMKYMPYTDQWVCLLKPMVTGVGAAAVVCNGKILLTGGDAEDEPDSDSTKMQEYDPGSNTWRLLDVKLPEGMKWHTILNIRE